MIKYRKSLKISSAEIKEMVYNHPGITNFITNNLPIDKMLKSGKLLFFLFFIDREIKKKTISR